MISKKADSLLTFGDNNLNKDSLKVSKEVAAKLNINLDSLLKDAKEDLRISDFRTDSLGILGNFFSALMKTEKDKTITRIAYFGDSMIEGDLITQTLREGLQRIFGGKGVGFVPVYSKTGGDKMTIHQQNSTNWKLYSYIDHVGRRNFGLTGFVFNPNILNKKNPIDTVKSTQSWVEFTAALNNITKTVEFDNARLFYGKGSAKNSVYTYFNKMSSQYPLSDKDAVNELTLNFEKPVRKIRFNFETDTLVDIFGFSFDGKSGVYLDNFGVRSNNGLPNLSIPESVLRGLNDKLNYNLVVIQYGLNVTTPDMRNFDWYKDAMVKVVKHFQKCMPNADILIVSVGDRSSKQGNEMKTMPCIPYLVEAQRKIAKETHCAFLNLFQNMGGSNAMVSWVEMDPALGNKDYTHVSPKGAEKLGVLLKDKLLNEYKIYKFNH